MKGLDFLFLPFDRDYNENENVFKTWPKDVHSYMLTWRMD
jgi:hypothetical protein